MVFQVLELCQLLLKKSVPNVAQMRSGQTKVAGQASLEEVLLVGCDQQVVGGPVNLGKGRGLVRLKDARSTGHIASGGGVARVAMAVQSPLHSSSWCPNLHPNKSC